MPHEIRGVDVEKYALLCQEASPKRWFGNMEMTSNCDVTNSEHQIHMTTIWAWSKHPHENFLRTPLAWWSSDQHYKQTGGKQQTIHTRYGFKTRKKLTHCTRAKNIICEAMWLFLKSTHLVHPCTPFHGGTPLKISGTPWGVRYTRLTSTAPEVPLWANSVLTLLVNSKGWSSLRVVFSQTKKFTAIAFSDANMYATSMTQRNVLKATVPDRMIWLPKPACIIASVRLSKALKDVHSKETSSLHVRAARFKNSC